MRHTQNLCGHCGRPVADGYLCQDGTDDLTDLLRWLTADVSRADREPDRDDTGRIARGSCGRQPSSRWDTPSGEARNLTRILDEQAARLAVRGGQVIGRPAGAEPPMPVDLRAVNDHGRIRQTIGHWATELTGQPHHLDGWWTVHTTAATLIAQTPAIRQHDWAADMLADVARVISRATRHIDNPPERRYLGICGSGRWPRPEGAEGPSGPCCDGQVFAIEGAPTGTCNRCRNPHDVASRQQQRVEQLHGIRLTAAEIERVTTELGRKVARNTITKWKERGRISCDGAGRYLVDDALRLAEQTTRRRAG